VLAGHDRDRVEELLQERASELVRKRRTRAAGEIEQVQRATGDAEPPKSHRGRCCIACGHEIPVARIKLMPGALRCVSCQLRLEGTTLPGEPA